MNVDNLWNNFLEQIKTKISSLSYDTWFKNTKLVSLDNNVAKILVDSPLQKKSLQETWYQTISDVFSEITNTSFDFEFVFESDIKAKENIKKYSKDFQGNLKDTEVMKLIGISRNSYYKYKKELIAEVR